MPCECSPTPRTVRWLGVRWIGCPWPVRVIFRTLRPRARWRFDGCGCTVVGVELLNVARSCARARLRPASMRVLLACAVRAVRDA